MSSFTKEQAQRARNADLAAFLLREDPAHYIREGNSVRLIDPAAGRKDRVKSVSVKMGANWWHDFKTGESGNCVEYLTKRMGYSLVDAIKALSGEKIEYKPSNQNYAPQEARKNIPPEFPEKTDTQPRQMFAYLCSRGIPAETIQQLKSLGLLYQSKEHNNLVFINKERDFAEIRGTYTYGKPFHGVIKNQPDRFWYFSIGRPQRAYICESAIDAISLYLLKKKENTHDGAFYVSIAGVANQQTIDRIKAVVPETIIAVDNDVAGQACRDRNPDCAAVIPSRKDWNEDLCKGPLTLNETIEEAESARSSNTPSSLSEKKYTEPER